MKTTTRPQIISIPMSARELSKETTIVDERSALFREKTWTRRSGWNASVLEAAQRRGKFPKDVDTKHYTRPCRCALGLIVASLQASLPAKKRPSTRLRGYALVMTTRGLTGCYGSGLLSISSTTASVAIATVELTLLALPRSSSLSLSIRLPAPRVCPKRVYAVEYVPE